jgi:hypothetical protein
LLLFAGFPKGKGKIIYKGQLSCAACTGLAQTLDALFCLNLNFPTTPSQYCRIFSPKVHILAPPKIHLSLNNNE